MSDSSRFPVTGLVAHAATVAAIVRTVKNFIVDAQQSYASPGTLFGLTRRLDDGIVVEGVKKARVSMRAHAALPALRSRVGNDGLLELHGMFESAQDEWKVDVLESACERFERRLSEEAGGLRAEMALMPTSLLRWMFVFWIGQLMTMLSIVAMILRAVNLL